MDFTATDHTHMAEALRLAARGVAPHPNPRVGCVLVRDGAVVGRGFHLRAGEAHAEAMALAEAGAAARGATAYVTLEPCCHHGRTPPCSEALIAAGVAEVVAAGDDPDPRVAGRGLAALAAAGVRVRRGLLGGEAERLNPGFLSRLRRGRPFVRVKLGVSLDGRTALADGRSQWVTGTAARADVQRLRARSDAILTGIGTLLADDPHLTVREAAQQPLRVVLDPRGRTPADARLLDQPGRTLVVTGGPRPALGARAEVAVLTTTPDGRLPLAGVLALLAERAINEVLVEAGPTLAGAFLSAGLADEVVLYQAPVLLGDGALPAFRLPTLTDMAARTELEVVERRMVGADLRIVARPRAVQGG